MIKGKAGKVTDERGSGLADTGEGGSVMVIHSAAILGLGAVGSYLLWGLEDKVSVIASGERAERLCRDGLWINEKLYHPRVESPKEAHGVDLLIVCLKYGALPGALDDIAEIVDEHTIVMSLMNGVDSEDIIANRIGMDHMVHALIKIASRRDGSKILFNGETTMGIIFGELDPSRTSERVDAIADFFEGSPLHYRVTDKILSEIWSKFRLNVGNNLPQAMIGCGQGALSDSEHVRAISNGLKAELEAIAKAKGIDIGEAQRSSAKGSPVKPGAKYSTLQDLEAGRHTEIDMFSGALIRMGAELGIPTPYNEMAYHIIKALEEKNDGRFNYDRIDAEAVCSR